MRLQYSTDPSSCEMIDYDVKLGKCDSVCELKTCVLVIDFN